MTDLNRGIMKFRGSDSPAAVILSAVIILGGIALLVVWASTVPMQSRPGNFLVPWEPALKSLRGLWPRAKSLKKQKITHSKIAIEPHLPQRLREC